MSILKRNTQIPPPSQTDKAFYAKKCQIWAKNGPNIGPHFLGGGGGVKTYPGQKIPSYMATPQKIPKRPENSPKVAILGCFGGVLRFFGGSPHKGCPF